MDIDFEIKEMPNEHGTGTLWAVLRRDAVLCTFQTMEEAEFYIAFLQSHRSRLAPRQ